MDADEKYNHMEQYHSDGSECICGDPVDFQGHFIPTVKHDKDNLREMEEDIQNKFF